MNTYNKQAAESAQREKDLAIFAEFVKIGREAFEFVNIEPGEYSLAELVKYINKAEKDRRPVWDEKQADTLGELRRVEVDGFACSFPLSGVFDLLSKTATAWSVPTAARPRFVREKEEAPAVLTVEVPTAAREVAKACDKKAREGYQALSYVLVDTERRALVASDSFVLTVCAAPFMEKAEGCSAQYLVPASLVKSGAGRLVIDTNEKAANGSQVADLHDAPTRWPAWARIFPQVSDTDGLTLDDKTRRALVKTVAELSKLAEVEQDAYNKDIRRVVIVGEAYTSRLHVLARRRVVVKNEAGEPAESWQFIDKAVNLPAELSRSFVLPFNGPRFATLPAFDTMYIKAGTAAAVFEGSHAAAVLMSVPLPDDFPTPCKTDEAPAWARPVDVVGRVVDVFKPAPVVEAESIEKTETPAEPVSEPVKAAESVESEPTTCEPVESIDEPTRPDYLQEGRAVAFYSIEHAAWLVGVVADPRPVSGEWVADFIFNSYRVVGVSAGQLTPARADRRELTADELKNLRAVVASYKEGAHEVAPRVLSDLWARGLRVLGGFVVERATREAVARVVVTYGKKRRRTLDAPCTGGRIELFKYPADLPDTIDTLNVEPVESIETEPTTCEPSETPAPVVESIEKTESEADHLTPAEILAEVEKRRAELQAAGTLNTDDDPTAPAFADGEAFEYLTDTGTTTPARVRSSHFVDWDDTAAPCWVYSFDCEPFADRHGVSIDGGTCDALRMKRAAEPTTSTTCEPSEPAEPVESINVPTPAAWSTVWACLPELTAESIDGEAPAPVVVSIETETESEADHLAPAESIETETEPAAVVVAADFTSRARRWLQVAACLVCLLIVSAAPTWHRVETPAPVILADTLNVESIKPDTLTTSTTCEPSEPAEVADPSESKADTLQAVSEPVKTSRASRRQSRPRVVVSEPDTLAAVLTADTLTVDTLQADHLAPLDTLRADTLNVESIKPDTLAVEYIESPDTLQADTLNVDTLNVESMKPDTLTTSTTCEPSEPAEVADPSESKADTCEAVSEPVKPVESIDAESIEKADPSTTSTPSTPGTLTPSTSTHSTPSTLAAFVGASPYVIGCVFNHCFLTL